MAVVLYHFTARSNHDYSYAIATITQMGYLGVPLFFIISGFVISASAYNRTPLQFAVSRFVRLYPAYWVGIAVTLLLSWLFGAADFSVVQVIANLTMLNDYLNIANVDGVYWTLQVELKFYACVFALLLLGVFEKHRIWLSLWLLCTISFALLKQPFFMPWLISPNYSPYFIAGVLFFLLHREGWNRYNALALLIASALCLRAAYLQAAGFALDKSSLSSWIAVLAVALFLLLFLLLARGRLNIPRSPTLLLLGALTYPIYLIHNRAGKALIDWGSQWVAEPVMVAAAIVAVLLVAYLIHRWIERPLATPLKQLLLAYLQRLPKGLRQALRS